MFMRMIYDEKLAQAAYLLGCQRTGEAIVIDPQRDVDRYLDLARRNGLRITAVAETHIHADFLSGARELAEQAGAKVFVSDEGGPDWKSEWLHSRSGGGNYEHQLLHDGDTFSVGNIDFRVMHTPGHTPEHIAFVITDRGSGASEPIGVATGDFLFVGDLGRPDLLETAAGERGVMEPAARQLHESVGRLRELEDFIQVWPAHGAGSACGKALGAVPSSTIGYERRFNNAVLAADSAEAFVDFILAGQPEPPLYFATMKRDNKVGPAILGQLPQPANMSPAELAALDARKVAIIDTRPWNDFRQRHLPHALSFPLLKTFNTDAGSMVRPDEDIYLVVEDSRLEEVIRDLVRIGLDRIKGWISPAALEQADDVEFAQIDEVEVEKAIELAALPDTQVVDVRRLTEYAEGHVPDALNFAHTRIAAHLHGIPRDKLLLVHCRSGIRSARASAFLQREGYRVANLRGGFLAWEKAAAEVIR